MPLLATVILHSQLFILVLMGAQVFALLQTTNKDNLFAFKGSFLSISVSVFSPYKQNHVSKKSLLKRDRNVGQSRPKT